MNTELITGNLPIGTQDDYNSHIKDLIEDCNELSKTSPAVCELTETYCNGVYARELKMPKGAVIVGRVHKAAHINVISKGEVRVVTHEGVQLLKAPSTFISPKHTQRALEVLEDTVWTTFHAMDEDKVDNAVDECTVKDFNTLKLLEA